MNPNNASASEIFLALISIAGVIANAWGFREALRRLRVVTAMDGIDTDLYIRARASVRAEGVRMFVQSYFCMLCVASIFLPPDQRPDPRFLTQRAWLVWTWIAMVRIGFLIAILGLSINSLLGVYEYRLIRRRYDGQRRHR